MRLQEMYAKWTDTMAWPFSVIKIQSVGSLQMALAEAIVSVVQMRSMYKSIQPFKQTVHKALT
jgi:putative lipoic acid-binding regulatory protein